MQEPPYDYNGGPVHDAPRSTSQVSPPSSASTRVPMAISCCSRRSNGFTGGFVKATADRRYWGSTLVGTLGDGRQRRALRELNVRTCEVPREDDCPSHRAWIFMAPPWGSDRHARTRRGAARDLRQPAPNWLSSRIEELLPAGAPDPAESRRCRRRLALRALPLPSTGVKSSSRFGSGSSVSGSHEGMVEDGVCAKDQRVPGRVGKRDQCGRCRWLSTTFRLYRGHRRWQCRARRFLFRRLSRGRVHGRYWRTPVRGVLLRCARGSR